MDHTKLYSLILGTIFLQVFCTGLNGNTYGTKYPLSGDKSAGLIKLAKLI